MTIHYHHPSTSAQYPQTYLWLVVALKPVASYIIYLSFGFQINFPSHFHVMFISHLSRHVLKIHIPKYSDLSGFQPTFPMRDLVAWRAAGRGVGTGSGRARCAADPRSQPSPLSTHASSPGSPVASPPCRMVKNGNCTKETMLIDSWLIADL